MERNEVFVKENDDNYDEEIVGEEEYLMVSYLLCPN